MTIEAITSHIQQLDWLHNPTVSHLASGYGNDNYRIDDGDNTYVCRVKKTAEFPDSLSREFSLYLFLESEGYDFCPKALYLSPEKNILIVSFIVGEEIPLYELSDMQIKQFAQQLYQLHSLDVNALQDFCTLRNLDHLPTIDPETFLQQYSFERFAKVDVAIVGQELVDWLATKLQTVQQRLPNIPSSRKYHITWVDVQKSVLYTPTERMYFFDFEHANIGWSAELGYLKIHASFTNAQYSTVVREYAKVSGQSETDLRTQADQEEYIIRINDVVWAAMKWSETNDDTFKKLTYERQKLVSDG